MSEEISAVNETPAPVEAGDTLGTKLRTAREHMGMDLEEAARQLCLSPRQLAALEADDFDMLPSPTFARGFIRNYARLVQIPADPLLASFKQKVPETSTAAPISLHSEGIPILNGRGRGWLPYLLASLLVVLAGVGWWLYMDWRESLPAPSAHIAAAPEPDAVSERAEVPAMGAGLTQSELMQPPPETPTVDAAAGAQPQVQAPAETQPQSQPQPQAPVSAGATRLVIKFVQPSWVRVQDGSGKELLNATKPADSQAVVEGVAPFKLDVGNAAGVQLSYKDHPVDLAPSTKANVAHLVLE